jgi:septal ring factor EnvC (AmiA/AmiB activator)
MKKEEQNPQQKNPSLLSSTLAWIEKISIKTRIVIISSIVLILGFIIINNSNNSELLKTLEESRKRKEEKLKAISLYENSLDKNKKSIKKIEDKIKNTELKIEEIIEEKSDSSSLDEFFDKRF